MPKISEETYHCDADPMDTLEVVCFPTEVLFMMATESPFYVQRSDGKTVNALNVSLAPADVDKLIAQLRHARPQMED
jgi:hypothetical protein